jgi:hypothetical protein
MSSRSIEHRPQSWLRPLLLGVSLLGIAGLASSAESRIELRDGTVLYGEVVSASGGAYRVRSGLLGEIQIPESNVVAIRPMGFEGSEPDTGQSGAAAPSTAYGMAPPAAASAAPSAATSGSDHQGELAAIQQQLVGDPDTLKAIMTLQNDPEIRAALADPAFAQLILSGNVEALSADPRFQRLMEHPGIKGIVGRTTGQ